MFLSENSVVSFTCLHVSTLKFRLNVNLAKEVDYISNVLYDTAVNMLLTCSYTTYKNTVNLLHSAVYSFWRFSECSFRLFKCIANWNAYMYMNSQIQEYANLNTRQFVQELFPPNTVHANYNTFTVHPISRDGTVR